MISLDTNILVRLFVDDEKQFEQCIKARQVVADYETVYVTQIVQVETVWVLSCAYGFSRAEVKLVLESLMNNEAFRLEGEEGFVTALQLYIFSNIDFSDAQILQASLQQEIKLLSFDKKLQKLKGVVNPDFI